MRPDTVRPRARHAVHRCKIWCFCKGPPPGRSGQGRDRSVEARRRWPRGRGYRSQSRPISHTLVYTCICMCPCNPNHPKPLNLESDLVSLQLWNPPGMHLSILFLFLNNLYLYMILGYFIVVFISCFLTHQKCLPWSASLGASHGRHREEHLW